MTRLPLRREAGGTARRGRRGATPPDTSAPLNQDASPPANGAHAVTMAEAATDATPPAALDGMQPTEAEPAGVGAGDAIGPAMSARQRSKRRATKQTTGRKVSVRQQAPPTDQQTLPPEVKADASSVEARPIIVELNAAAEGWPTQSRFDVVLVGQITSIAPIDTFTIRDSHGLELAAVQFGHGDDQEMEALTDGGTIYRTGFQVFLPMPAGEEVRIADMWVRARARNGTGFEESMRLGCMADRAAILAGPVRATPETEIPAPRVIVYLESAEISSDGRLLVNGR